jgi:hypothetical protein
MQSFFFVVMDPARVPLTMVIASKSSSFFEDIRILLCLGIGLRGFDRNNRNARPADSGAKVEARQASLTKRYIRL